MNSENLWIIIIGVIFLMTLVFFRRVRMKTSHKDGISINADEGGKPEAEVNNSKKTKINQSGESNSKVTDSEDTEIIQNNSF